MRRLAGWAALLLVAAPVLAAPIDDMARTHHIDPAQLRSWRAEGLSWADIGRAIAVTEKDSVPAGQVLEEYRQGRDWSRVTWKHGFKTTDIERRSREVEKEGLQAEQEEHGARR